MPPFVTIHNSSIVLSMSEHVKKLRIFEGNNLIYTTEENETLQFFLRIFRGNPITLLGKDEHTHRTSFRFKINRTLKDYLKLEIFIEGLGTPRSVIAGYGFKEGSELWFHIFHR